MITFVGNDKVNSLYNIKTNHILVASQTLTPGGFEQFSPRIRNSLDKIKERYGVGKISLLNQRYQTFKFVSRGLVTPYTV